MQRLIVLELNEINFGFVEYYSQMGLLPHFSRFLDGHGYCETTSEQVYEHLEPWIQWVTAHTGLSFAEHGVLRLGDIIHHDYDQIWEILEREHGLTTGGISPMNANNRLERAAFFVPDPWTNTGLTSSALLSRLYYAISQAVNDNAQARVTPRSLAYLLSGWMRYAQPRNWSHYVRYTAEASRKPWTKALFMDLLLTDVFLREWKRSEPHFATLFLNAGAHIQHHYMFSSAAYAGPQRNPDWYIAPGADPLLEAYALYDRMLGQVLKLGHDVRIMLATGLHQDPHPTLTYYYRLRAHAEFLQRIGVPFERVVPRMSRDFHVYCSDAEEASTAEARLNSAVARDGVPIFSVDNRGSDLFVMLTYPHEISLGFEITVGNQTIEHFDRDIAFVALKNGMHNGIGYFSDSGSPKGSLPRSFPLKELPSRIRAVFSTAATS